MLEQELKEIQEETSLSQQTCKEHWCCEKKKTPKGDENRITSKASGNSEMKTTDEKHIIFITFHFAAHNNTLTKISSLLHTLTHW